MFHLSTSKEVSDSKYFVVGSLWMYFFNFPLSFLTKLRNPVGKTGIYNAIMISLNYDFASFFFFNCNLVKIIVETRNVHQILVEVSRRSAIVNSNVTKLFLLSF